MYSNILLKVKKAPIDFTNKPTIPSRNIRKLKRKHLSLRKRLPKMERYGFAKYYQKRRLEGIINMYLRMPQII